jgi:hypothetical protein
MRARLLFLVVAILLVAGFAALNWSEFMRPAPLSFGTQVVDAPLGLIMLGILGVTLLVFLISSAMQNRAGSPRACKPSATWLKRPRRHASPTCGNSWTRICARTASVSPSPRPSWRNPWCRASASCAISSI